MTNTTHIMLDLETWGKKPGCDIRSIGATVFDPVAGTVEKPILDISKFPPDVQGIGATSFYIATDNPIIGSKSGGWVETLGFTPNIIDPHYDNNREEYRKYPLHRDPETVQWWNDQTPEAQAAFANPVDLAEALIKFSEWLFSTIDRNILEVDNIRIWANDPHFDVSILDACYTAVGLPVPWHYRAPRSMRTVVELAGMTRDDYCNYGEPHNALHDSIAQAMTVCEAYKQLGLQK